MIEPLLLFFSNRTEILYERLKNQLFPSFSRPFAKRLVVVQGPAMQNWLTFRLANDLGIATGIEFIFLNRAFPRLLEMSQQNHSSFPNPSELALATELELRTLKNHFHSFSEREKEDWQLVASYLIDKPEARLLSLSQQLGRSFYEYGRTHESAPSEKWQNQLWRSIHSKNPLWSWPALQYLNPIEIKSDIEIHFFAVSDLNECECNYLMRLGSQLPLHYYFLSPCMMYWSDSRSDRERASLLSYWQDKEVNSGQLNTLSRLLEDRNPLLANWGKKGRGLVEYLEEKISHHHTDYRLASGIKEWPEVHKGENLSYDATDHPLTLLQAIQADLLFLRNPEENPPIQLLAQDTSVQIHSAPNKRREVEALYNTLMGILDNQSTQITPSDIIVICPQLNEYVSYIQYVFERKESLLTTHFLDDHSLANQEMIQTLLDLISLSNSRWETPILLQLFSHPAFQRRHQISGLEFQLIKKWVKKSQITWGFDSQHRQQLFKNHHSERFLEDNASGTWIFGLERMQYELVSPSDVAEKECFERFKNIVTSLYKTLASLQNGTQMSLEEWMNYFQKLVESHISCLDTDPKSLETYEFILNQFDYLKASHRHFKNHRFSFESLNPHLISLLKQKKKNYQMKPYHAISFGSFTDFKSQPSKVIAILGMDEGAFPRLKADTDLLVENASHPLSLADEDRYLFLETIHSAREALLIFFSLQNRNETSAHSVSPVVEELLSYCDRFYTIEDKLPSSHCTTHHPFHAYSTSYFLETSALRNYFPSDYQKALIQTHSKKATPVILTEFEKPERPKKNPHSVLFLQELQRAAKNPIKLHLNRSLGIYLDNEEKRQFQTDENLQLTPLDKYSIREKSLRKPIEFILEEKGFQLPLGLFKNVATQQSKEEADILLAKLAKHQVKPEDLFTIEFSADCLQPEQKAADLWIFPAPEILLEGKNPVKITGKLPHVSPQGLILLEKSSANDIWKNWPTLLMFSYAAQLYPQLMQNQIIFTQAAKTKSFDLKDPLALLSDWSSYYHLCLNQFSPLLPDWIPFIVNQDREGLKKQHQKIFSDFSSTYAHEELRWVFHPDHLPCPEKLIQDWSELAKVLAKSME